jgi:hypothetical protein
MQEEKHRASAARRQEALVRQRRVTVREAAFEYMEQAYLQASTNGEYPAKARQIMYAARGKIQDRTGKYLDDQYFTQQLLPDYLTENPATTSGWDVVFDARGHFTEPHTKLIVPLGTLEVRQYLGSVSVAGAQIGHSPVTVTVHGRFPTVGPKNCYGAILFIEKEGFEPLFKAAKLAQRFDIAIMSTKGMPVTAARTLVERLCAEHGIPLLVLHDFDKSGFSIVGTFKRDTRRYAFKNAINVIDLGLRLADVSEWELESEDVAYGNCDPRPNLRTNGATDEEVEFLCGRAGYGGYSGKRVELNAFSSGDLISAIEAKLKLHRITKVIPDHDTLAAAYRRAREAELLRKRIEEIKPEVRKQAEAEKVPKSLDRQVKAMLKDKRELPWDVAIGAIAILTDSAKEPPEQTP